MRSGARTPEELEALFEDAVLLGDRDAVVKLFEPGAVLASDGSMKPAEPSGSPRRSRRCGRKATPTSPTRGG